MSVLQYPIERKISSRDKHLVKKYIEFEIREVTRALQEIQDFTRNSLTYKDVDFSKESEEIIETIRRRAYDEDGNIRPKTFFKVMDFLESVEKEANLD